MRLLLVGAIGGVLGGLGAVAAAIWAWQSSITAKKALAHEETAYRQSRTARPSIISIRVNHTSRNRAVFTFGVHNAGQAVASNVRVRLRWPKRQSPMDWWPDHLPMAESREPLLSLKPHDEPSENSIVLEPQWDHIDGILHVDLLFEDGSGSHEKSYWFSLVDSWEDMKAHVLMEAPPPSTDTSLTIPHESRNRAYSLRHEPD